jgi:hypothetical protein
MLQMANEVEKRTKERQQSLKAAFSLLIRREQNWIDGATMIALFHAMSSYRLVTQVIADSSFILFCQNVFSNCSVYLLTKIWKSMASWESKPCNRKIECPGLAQDR